MTINKVQGQTPIGQDYIYHNLYMGSYTPIYHDCLYLVIFISVLKC